jgi:Tol biopolymer transport system component/DNA-binding winged helix-turn-helix (wHTH) protein
MDSESRYLLTFGPFRVDLDQRLLMRGEESIPLAPKAFETLLVLLRNSGRVVLKDDLMKALWPDTFVEESNLSQHIYQLRKTLGPGAQDPQYIVTVPGRGYRFAQKVEQVSAGNGNGFALEGYLTPRVEVKQEKPTSHPFWLVTAALGVTAAVTLGLLLQAVRPASRPLFRLSVGLPDFVVTEPTSGSSLAISSSGTRVTYTGRGPNGTLQLYTRALDQERALPLAGTEGAYSPFFSPDGQTIAFFADGKLKKVPVGGGEATVLCNAPKGVGGSWGEDGAIIAALDTSGGLSRIFPNGGLVQPVTKLRQESSDLGHIWPQVLPGAEAVLFTAVSTTANIPDSTIEVQSLKTGQRKTLVRGGYYGRYMPSGHLVYMRGRTLYAAPMDVKRLAITGSAVPVVEDISISSVWGTAEMDFSRSGTLVYAQREPVSKALMWLDGTGKTQLLRSAGEEYNPTVRLSPDGKRLALAVVGSDSVDVWVYEWERNTMTRLTFGSHAWWPIWSPDGKHIAFMSSQHGEAANLYYTRADGAGEAVRLTESRNRQIPYSFSPDGKRLAFFEFNPQTQTDIWTLPLEDPGSDRPKAGKPEPFLVTPFDERAPMISPDGRWLAYESNESGRSEVYVQPFPRATGKWQVSVGGGDRPVWSRKAQELFYRNSDGIMVASYSVRGLAFVVNKPRLWTAKKDLGMYFDLAPDGKRFVIVKGGEPQKSSSEQVMLLENFFDELRRRAPTGVR